jgi:cohesin loading factor subunit SCC2
VTQLCLALNLLQLYSEEVITSCLSTVKNQLTKIVYPFVDTSGDTATASPLLQHLIKNHTSSQTHRRQLSELFQALSSVLLRITNLISAETVVMSDSIIIQAVYIAIGPFFVVDVGVDGEGKGKKDNIILSTLGASAMRGLRMNALSLIRGVSVCVPSTRRAPSSYSQIFANHDDQRSWIIEEILTSLIKLSDTKQKAGQFRCVMTSCHS